MAEWTPNRLKSADGRYIITNTPSITWMVLHTPQGWTVGDRSHLSDDDACLLLDSLEAEIECDDMDIELDVPLEELRSVWSRDIGEEGLELLLREECDTHYSKAKPA